MMQLETGITLQREYFSKGYRKTKTKKIKKMSKNNKELPSFTSIPDLTQEKVNRLLTADYLEHLADLIRKDKVAGLDLAWSPQLQKPVGRVILVSAEITGPLQAKWEQEIADNLKAAQSVIPVQDLTQEIAEHGKCENPRCIGCNPQAKA
jgi:hypothetical protein